MEIMKVEILSRELVKPSSPTPTHLRDYKLCLLDQFIPETHGGIIFFYSFNPDIIQSNNNSKNDNDENYYCSILKKSLADTLTDFYPIAGRFKDTSTINCNDNGACVVEAKLNSTLSDFLISISKSSGDLHNKIAKLVPTLDLETMELASKCMLIAQVTIFECGGVAINFCLEHRFCDLSSVVTFLKSWSARARGGGSDNEITLPNFVASSSFLPPQDLPPLPPLPNTIANRTTTRLVFDSSKISALKSKYITESAQGNNQYYKNISRVEVVLALIMKSAVSAARWVTKTATKSVIFQAVNLRKRTVPPLPDNSIGNLFWMVPVIIEEGNIEFHEVVSKMKRETTSFYDETVGRIKGDDEGNSLVFESIKQREEILKKIADVDRYAFSSWCRFPVYEMDFGWGKPVLVSSGVVSPRNLIVFEDTKCGNGIQAWVTLDPKVMAVFERDEELLSFASLNPSILIAS